MSTESRASNGAAQQPPLSQLWPGFGLASSELTGPQQLGSAGAGGSLALQRQSSASDTNYVNFNQFMIQHNLVTSPTPNLSTHNNVGAANVAAAAAATSSAVEPAALALALGGLPYQQQQHHHLRNAHQDQDNNGQQSNNYIDNNNDIASAVAGFSNKLQPFRSAQEQQQQQQQQQLQQRQQQRQQQQYNNFFNPASDLFSYNAYSHQNAINGNDPISGSLQNFCNLTATAATSSSSPSSALYYDSSSFSGASYGGGGGGGGPLNGLAAEERNGDAANHQKTAYYVNPFATGFDFTATNLHASAPEFVPRFEKLSLNEGTTAQAQAQLEPMLNKDSVAMANGGQPSQEIPEARANHYNTDNSYDKEEKRLQQRNDRRNGRQGANKHEKENNRRSNNRLERNMERFSRNLQDKSLNNDSASNSNSSTPSLSHNGGGDNGGTRQQMTGAKPVGGGAFNKAGQNQGTRNGGDNKSRNYNNRGSGGVGGGNPSNAFAAASEFEGGRERPDKYGNNRRYQNGGAGGGRRSQDYGGDREERFERYADRGDRSERGRNQRNDYHQRYESYRSNKRRDDWNRNRDRINGFRVEEKYSQDNGKDSPLPSPEKRSPKKIYPENEKLSQREKLIRDIEYRRLECLVCVESIKAHQGVWSCHNCYHIMHLQCIIKWASSSKSDDGWRCPACQNVEKDVPRDYFCFCGKLKNPPNNRQDIAHSCGEVCGRIEGCPHACTLLCHPGPCPPCQAQVTRECGCGKTSKTLQCCLKETIACDSTCEKLLNCELHTCQEKCHEGKCPPCKQKVDQTCHCAKNERQVTCTRESHDKHFYSCGKPCGKDLACGNHKCKDCCHAGDCKTCKMSPDVVTSCPCGKLPIVAGQRQSCLDAIPVCEGTCGKTLKCGKATNPHHCTFKCHLGNCPPCNKQTAVKCRCGHMDQMIKCRQLSTRADDARCKKRCTKKRSCGKHKCNQECCIDIDHFCPLPCNYTLSCGKHKCDQPCHRGNCPPCYRSSFEELFCECGAEVIYPPVPCGTKKPVCKRPCSRKHPCDHPPQHNCHSSATCPPCMMFTTKWCFGQHEQRKTIPCSQQSFSCGLACNKPLPCGRHKCIRTCHEGACQTAGDICKQSCTTPRASCGHKCMAPCHEGTCPETPCKEMVEVQCECGNRKQMRTCAELAREFSRIATAQLASSMAEMQRGNYMELSEILAPVKLSNKSNKTLDCNDECRLLERNRRLAIGLQVRNPDLPQKLQTKYSDFIRNFAKRDAALVKSVHDALTTLVKLAKESKQKSRSHSFPTMNREKRQLVHEMCEMFGVESVAYDAEPNRNVVATAFKDRSWLPATSIMEVMNRESGQRRVPVPSNNAWGLKR